MAVSAELDIPFVQDLCERFGTHFKVGISVMVEGGEIVAATDRTRIGKRHPISARIMAHEIDEYVVTTWRSWRSRPSPFARPTMVPGCNTALDFRGRRIANLAVAAHVAKAKKITQIIKFCLLALIEAHVVEKENAQRNAETLQRAIEDITREFRGTVQAVVPSVIATVDGMAHETHGAGQALEQEAEGTRAVSEASDQAARNVDTVAANVSQLSSSIAEVNQRMGNLADITQQARERTDTTQRGIALLADGTAKISQVVDLIREVSSQTNLLALNATIEAARAGQAGKGFAVVAGEVNALAHRTGQATNDIATLLATIQQQARQAVEDIRSIAEVVANTTEIAAAVAAAMEQQSAATTAIAHNAQEAATATGEIGRRVDSLRKANDVVGDTVQRTAEASVSLREMSNRLNTAIDGFLADLDHRAA